MSWRKDTSPTSKVTCTSSGVKVALQGRGGFPTWFEMQQGSVSQTRKGQTGAFLMRLLPPGDGLAG